MALSEPQIKAIEQIIKIDEFEPGRWFTQMELYRVESPYNESVN